MKKKLIFIAMTMALFLPIVIVKADCTSATSGVCNQICYDMYGSNNSNEFPQCSSACMNYNETVTSACSSCDDSCVKEKLCSLGAYKQSSYCTQVNAGNNPIAVKVCNAICSGAYTSGNSGCNTNCLNDSKNYECKTEQACKTDLCKVYGNSYAFCTSDLTATNYLNYQTNYSTYVIGDSDNGSSSSSNSNESGTIEDDADNMKKMDVKNCYGFGDVVYYISLFIRIMQIVAPIILIIWASVDLFKSVIASDEKKIIEKRKPIIQRFVAAVLVFLVPWIVNSIVNNFDSKAEWFTCWKNYRYQTARDSHSNANEDAAVKEACQYVCASNSDKDKCVKKCVEDYSDYSEVCADAKPSDTSGYVSNNDIAAAKVACYKKYAQDWYKNYK